jgi:hypothetical protein
MRTITLQINDSVNEKFLWLLEHFSKEEIKILEESEYICDDDYLRSIEGMVESIKEARAESMEQGLSLDQLTW